jgi:tetratricopeptide (TPR) repeat protein
MVFSSKSRSPYTQMFLTHIDEEGNDSPPILIENSTAANRAVNIPEFVDIAADGLLNIDVPAAEFYRLYDKASELTRAGDFAQGAEVWRQAIALEPDDARGHNNLGVTLTKLGRRDEALESFRRAVALRPEYGDAQFNLGAALWARGDKQGALEAWENASRASGQDDPAVLDMLAGAYAAAGRGEDSRRTAMKALALAERLNDEKLAAAIRARLKASR